MYPKLDVIFVLLIALVSFGFFTAPFALLPFSPPLHLKRWRGFASLDG